MSDHLPECHTSMIPDFHNERWICICPVLRACEQRVRQSAATLWDRTSEQMAAARVEGFRAGLDAAREAVAGVLHWSEGELGLICNWNSACDAIDALKEET